MAERYAALGVLSEPSPGQVVVSPGGKYSCYLAILATCGPGDEVIIPAPYWVSYPEMVKLAGATSKVVFAGDEQGFKVTPAQIEDALTPLDPYADPQQPFQPDRMPLRKSRNGGYRGACLQADDFLVMSDEIYEYLLYDGAEHHRPASFGPEAAERVITVSGFSKTFSMTGWRLGTLVANPEISKAVADLQSQTSSNATTFAQYGALEAMLGWDRAMDAVSEMLVHFDRRRLNLLKGLEAIEGVSCQRAQGPLSFPQRLCTGSWFGGILHPVAGGAESCGGLRPRIWGRRLRRLSYATSDEVIEKGLSRIQDFCREI